jgi:hypothetical protein
LLIASDTLKLVKTYFEVVTFLDQSKEVKRHARWALRPDGLAYHAKPTPIDCIFKVTNPDYVVSDQCDLIPVVDE